MLRRCIIPLRQRRGGERQRAALWAVRSFFWGAYASIRRGIEATVNVYDRIRESIMLRQLSLNSGQSEIRQV